MTADIPRVLITAGKSGEGKTMLTCGILEALKRRGIRVTAYKCGPDYIDPMFHREVLGIPSYNLDTFLCGREKVRELLICHQTLEEQRPGEQVSEKQRPGEQVSERQRPEEQVSEKQRPGEQVSEKSVSGERPSGKQASFNQIAVIEGVMGYYDGLGGVSHKASTYDVADATDTPAVLIVNCKGVSVSVIPYIQGFLKYQDKEALNSHIKGVILNRISPAVYGRMKELVERQTPVCVYGYVPEIKDISLESRYLGLKMPGEITGIREKLERLGNILEDTLDIDGLIELAKRAEPLGQEGCIIGGHKETASHKERQMPVRDHPRIAVARDEAFCFIYEDNLSALAGLGAEIIEFSPIHDSHLPKNIDGVIFYGGYPELYAEQLSGNHSMREQVRQAVSAGLPCIAECGGFMYLTESIRDSEGDVYPMCGVFGGESFYMPTLRRFGYVALHGGKVFGKDVGDICAHEFHYYDSEQCGEAFEAKKPLSDRAWKCMISTDSVLAGYPHIHYGGNPKVAETFTEACCNYGRRKDRWSNVD